MPLQEINTMSHNAIEQLEELLKERVGVRIKRGDNSTLAAVMIIIKEEHDDYSMLFIKRIVNSSDIFSGHMAFPGGKMEETDRDTLETAIRETFEETGIDLNKVGGILGNLDDFNPNNPRAKHYIVTPYIAFVSEEVELQPHEMEVAEALWIPLSHFRDKKNKEVRTADKYGMKVKDFVFYYQDYVIWGMTARIFQQFLRLAGHLFNVNPV